MKLDQVEEVLVEHLSFGLIEAEEGDLPHRRPIQKAVDQRGQRLLDGLSRDTAPGPVEGVDHEPTPLPLTRKRQKAPYGRCGRGPAEQELLSHHGPVHDRLKRQRPCLGQDDLPLSDRTLANRRELDLRARRLLDRKGGAGSHPEVVIRRQEEGLPFRPPGAPLLDVDSCLDEVK